MARTELLNADRFEIELDDTYVIKFARSVVKHLYFFILIHHFILFQTRLPAKSIALLSD